ncbi:DUF3500 domain-containing protein [Solicola sp. PLA-1-18]|uniref:DUF3500 domain-containing protein n=1 Tax=Solicola sp. PLA-1-18 TaxID=3380532 RepID=UPI003B7929F5
MNKIRRTVVAPIAVLALVTGLAACSSSDSTDASSSSTSSENGPPQGGSGGGPGQMQTFTAVDLNTDGTNASDANTTDVVKATDAFLATLTDEQKNTATYDFSDNQSRQTWSNYPASTVARKGIALTDLSAESKTAAMAVVKTMLSAQGYSQVEAIQKADDWLKANSDGGNSDFGDENYYIAVYGTPSTTDPFMVQFGGHHLARNYTYKGTTASITPDFTGTEPKSFTIDNTDVEPMKEKAGTAFAVFDSLTDDQTAQAKLSATLNDILMGPGVDSGKFPTTEGLKVSDLSTAQQKLVLAAIAAWVDDANPGMAASLMKTYESQLDQTTIAFSGSDTVDGDNTYLRIDGPRVWIELVNTRSRSTPNVHYHGVYRDKTDDYGSTNPSA